MKLSIIIPAYNEEKRLEKNVYRVTRFLYDNNMDFEVIIVDDGSTDKTLALARTISEDDKSIHVETYDNNHGKGFAVRTGVLTSKGEFIFYMDADGSTPIEELPFFLNDLMRGTQVVIGSRHLPGSTIDKKQPAYRRFFGRSANKIIRLLLLPGISDSQCGFKGFSRDAAVSVFTPLKIFRWGFDFEVLTRARQMNYEIVERPVTWNHEEGSRIRPIKSFVRTFLDLLYVFLFVKILKK